MGIFLVTLALLAVFGLIPNELQTDTSGGPSYLDQFRISATNIFKDQKTVTNVDVTKGEVPLRIMIEKAGVDSIIVNPTNADVDVLDNELSKGVVHYPGSGTLGSGNVFLFGHSTSFKIVQNKAYKVFNNLSTLKSDDLIKIYSNTSVYTYKINSVELVNKEKTLVEFDTKNQMVTISTCDSFGQKSDRYVVKADFVSKEALK